MPRFQKSIFTPQHPEKYIGKHLPIMRSSWETSFAIFCDHHNAITEWASEPFAIKYHDPLTNKLKSYFPDFLIMYVDQTGTKKCELIEIKPIKQTGRKKSKSLIDTAQTVRNHAKWAAAQQYCSMNGIQFRILTENEIFKTGTK